LLIFSLNSTPSNQYSTYNQQIGNNYDFAEGVNVRMGEQNEENSFLLEGGIETKK